MDFLTMSSDVIFTVNGIFEGIRVVSVSRYREIKKKIAKTLFLIKEEIKR